MLCCRRPRDWRGMFWRCNPEGFGLKTKIVKKLRCWGTLWLEVPRFVEGCVVACLDHTIGRIEILGVLVCGSVTKEGTRVVVLIKLASAVARLSNANPRSKGLKVGDDWLSSIPSFVWGHLECGVDQAVVEVDGVEEYCRPELGWEPRPVREGTDFDSKFVVVDLSCAIL